MSTDHFRMCDGCGAPTGLLQHKPDRLCDDCAPNAMWAEVGEVVQHIDGTTGTVVTVDEYVRVLVSGRWLTAEWALSEARRIG